MTWTQAGGYSNRCRHCGRWWDDADGGCNCPDSQEPQEEEEREDEAETLAWNRQRVEEKKQKRKINVRRS